MRVAESEAPPPARDDAWIDASPQELQAATEEAHAQRLAELDEELRNEARDEGWAHETEAAVVAIGMNPDLADSVSVLDVTCGSSFCKGNFAHPDGASREAFLGRMLEHPPFNDTRGHVAIEPGSNASTVYFTRDGQTPLPL